MKASLVFLVTVTLGLGVFATAQTDGDDGRDVGTAFTYQGQVNEAGAPLNATADFQFSLWDAVTGGSQVGSTVPVNSVNVVDGLFTVPVDFGAGAFPGDSRWLQIAVRTPSGSGSFTTLSPRQQLTPTPHAIYSATAGTVTGTVANADKVDGYHAGNSYGQVAVSNGTRCSNLNADLLDGQDASAFLSPSSDYGRSGVASALYANSYLYVGSRVTAGISSDIGYLHTYGPNGNVNVNLGYTTGYYNNGCLSLRDSAGTSQVIMGVGSQGNGFMTTYGPNGNRNLNLSYLTGYPNNGFVSIRDSAGNQQAGMYVDTSGNGIVFGDTKSFRIPYPGRPDTEIWYACVEGPEAAAYIRGTGRLMDGQALIQFPEHFTAVASQQGMTVQLTALSPESKGLAVTDKALDGVVIDELWGGTGNYEFDYLVMAVRSGHEEYRVIRSAGEAQPAVCEVTPEDRAGETEQETNPHAGLSPLDDPVPLTEASVSSGLFEVLRERLAVQENEIAALWADNEALHARLEALELLVAGRVANETGGD